MPKTNFIEADVIKNLQQGEMELDLPNITYDELPTVSVLTITYKRKHFFQLMWNNWNNYKYPKEKIEWVIIDDSPGDDNDLTDIIPNYPNIRYIKHPKHMAVGEKRNFGVERCRNDIIVHQDDDDYYFPDSILAKVRILKRYPKCGCCFSNSLAAYNIMNNISYMMDPQIKESCLSLPEASLMYKKSFWEQQKFPAEHFAEGKGFVKGRQKKFVSIPCVFNMVSFTHSRNMTGLSRNIETKSIKTDAKISNYYDLFDGITKNIIRKLARLTNKELAPTSYDRVFYMNQHGIETECTGDVCSIKNLGDKEIEMIGSVLPNWTSIKSADDLDTHAPLTDNDLVLVCMYGTDILNILTPTAAVAAAGVSAASEETTAMVPKHSDSLSTNGVKLLQHPRSKLLIYNAWECRDFVDPYKKGELCKYCIDHLNISLGKVIMATTDFLNPMIHSLSPQVIGYDFPYLYAKANYKESDISDAPASSRTKVISMFTRRGTIERTAVANFLYTFFKDKVSMSYLTIDKYDESDIEKYGVVCKDYKKFTEALPIIPTPPTAPTAPTAPSPPLSESSDTPAYQIDEAAAMIYRDPMVKVNWETQDDIRHLVSDSFVMLTMETNAQGSCSNVQQVSEKTYKAIKMGMPFINFTAKPGILKHLHSLGFKTFKPMIDESYDYPTFQHRTEDHEILEKQYYDRFRKLLKELNRLCQMSRSELEKLWEDCQPIAQHNLKILQSLDPKHIKQLPIVEK